MPHAIMGFALRHQLNQGGRPIYAVIPLPSFRRPGIATKNPTFLARGTARSWTRGAGCDGRRGIQTRRSTIIFLISAIALAGVSPLGQVLVQFMMVWQR